MNRAQIAQQLAADRDATLVPPYDEPDDHRRGRTAAMELIEDVGPLDVLLVCTAVAVSLG